MRILFLVSGVYPHYMGGVSTWAHELITNLPDFEFTIVSVVSNPHVELRYPIAPNVKKIITLPLWGTDRPEEYDNRPLISVISRARKTNEEVIESKFIPSFKIFFEELISGGKNPDRLGIALSKMHQFFAQYDYKTTMRSRAIWDTCFEIIQQNPMLSRMSSQSFVNICRSLDRYLRILTLPVPEADLSHCAIAGVSGIMGVLGKIEKSMPFILTEHGVYYRERLLDIINLPLDNDFPARFFWGNFFRALVRVNYYYADALYPVCSFNIRWEDELGWNHKPKKVIYNGVDTDRFRPIDLPKQVDVPTIASVIRIDRFKDPLNLIVAMSHVVKAIPTAVCFIWGPCHDEDYAKLCVETVERYNLQNHIRFMGFTREPVKAYNMADVVVMPSLTEGFPFALLEAMACGKPIVATDIGGVREALGDCGILVPPRSPKCLAEAIVKLLSDKRLAMELGKKARERVVTKFSLNSMIAEYRSIYEKGGRIAANS